MSVTTRCRVVHATQKKHPLRRGKQAMPTMADKVFPAITALSRDIGLWNNTKTKSAFAPKEAMSHSSIPLCSTRNLGIAYTNKIPVKVPKTQWNHSIQDTGDWSPLSKDPISLFSFQAADALPS